MTTANRLTSRTWAISTAAGKRPNTGPLPRTPRRDRVRAAFAVVAWAYLILWGVDMLVHVAVSTFGG